jgi:outer membrane receptor protein involved in Fe transport
MSFSIRSITVSALLASAAFVPFQAQAQDAEEASSGGIPDIIVTAQKRAQSINDVGLTITALGDDALKNLGIQSLQDIAKAVPGLNFADSGWGTPIITLRGVGFSDNSLSNYPTTSVYIDEVPLPFAVMASHANLDLERLEVLKGPQGTLFGQNSTGGAVNYIAAKPTKEFAAGMDATIGRFGRGEANGFVSGPITDTLGVRVAGQYGYGRGWQQSYTRNDTNGKQNYVNGRILADWQATPALKIQLNINGWRDTSDTVAPQMYGIQPLLDFDPDGAGPLDPISLLNPDYAAYDFAPDNPHYADWSTGRTRPRATRSQYQGALRADLDVTDAITLTSITSYTKYNQDQVVDLDGTDIEDYGFRLIGSIRSFNQELRLAGTSGTFNWVLGANYERSRTFEDQYQFYLQSSVAAAQLSETSREDALGHKRNMAVFVSGDYKIAENLTLKAGVRYTKAKADFNICNFDSGDGTVNATISYLYSLLHGGAFPVGFDIGDCATLDPAKGFEPSNYFGKLNEDSVSWRVGVDYKPNRDLLLYATVAKGYKSGAWPTSGALVLTTYDSVKQESLLDYEVGFKAQLADRKVSLNGAAFYYDYRDKQIFGRYIDPYLGVLNRLANIPKSRVMGAELELNALPMEGLSINAGVTYLDAKITKYSGVNAGGLEANFAGAKMPFTSKWQYIAGFDYKVPTNGGIRPFFGATVSGRSKMTSVIGNVRGLVPNAGARYKVPLDRVFDLPSYSMFDLRVGIEPENEAWKLTLWGRNITNELSVTNVISTNDAVGRYTGMPATYGATFAYKFR